jgi:hypothetical protein
MQAARDHDRTPLWSLTEDWLRTALLAPVPTVERTSMYIISPITPHRQRVIPLL